VNFLYDDIVHALQNTKRLVHKFGYAQIDEFGNNRKPLCDFLLVINTYLLFAPF